MKPDDDRRIRDDFVLDLRASQATECVDDLARWVLETKNRIQEKREIGDELRYWLVSCMVVTLDRVSLYDAKLFIRNRFRDGRM